MDSGLSSVWKETSALYSPREKSWWGKKHTQSSCFVRSLGLPPHLQHVELSEPASGSSEGLGTWRLLSCFLAHQANIRMSDRKAWKTNFTFLNNPFAQSQPGVAGSRYHPRPPDLRWRVMCLELARDLTAANITFNMCIKMNRELSSVCHFLLILEKPQFCLKVPSRGSGRWIYSSAWSHLEPWSKSHLEIETGQEKKQRYVLRFIK